VSEAKDLGWEESETGYRPVYITDRSARQSWTTTYPKLKKRVVSQNLRSVGESRRRIPETKKIEINNIFRFRAHGQALRYPHNSCVPRPVRNSDHEALIPRS